jgi:hypothetical protein
MPDYKTVTGMYEAFKNQRADSNLLAIIGSWRDTTEDLGVIEAVCLAVQRPSDPGGGHHSC